MGITMRLLLPSLLIGYFLDSSLCKQWTTSFPKKITALKGYCVVIPCTFTDRTNNPLLDIIWFQHHSRQDGEIYNSHDSSSVLKSFQGRTTLVGDLSLGNCSLKIEKITTFDANKYYPQISSFFTKGIFLFYNSTISVQVSPGKVIINNPGEMTEGNLVKITCYMIHTCPPSPPSIKWIMKGHPSKTYHEQLTDGEWKIKSVLTYSPHANDDGQMLQCTVYRSGETSSASRILTVMYAPKNVFINSSHEDGQVKEGEDVMLSCLTNSNPDPNLYSWYKDGLVLNQNQSVFQIESMTEADAGSYYCMAHNRIGEAASPPVTLNCSFVPGSFVPGAHSRSLFPVIVGVVSGVVVVLFAVLTTIIVSKKCKKCSRSHAKEVEYPPNDYMNVQFTAKPEVNQENPYTTLKKQEICPDYDYLKPANHLKSAKEDSNSTLQFTESPSHYEEVIPQKPMNIYPPAKKYIKP
ncbi:sialoadhesin-like [Discoglossus pictus]